MLYNKERPASLSDVLGQEHIIETFKKQCESRKFSHSYLFEGHHGCGKTSVAYLMGRAANCENPTENGPCNKCPSCLSAMSNSSSDFTEIDAASNNGVDNIRDIVENCNYLPTMGKYKVYIIDEVHMLSTSAFNALLKTLENPPKHAIFFLCTTDMHKLPSTVVSRCEKYRFKAIDEATIATKLSEVCDKYEKAYELDALYLVARSSNGALRDALSILGQLFSEDEITAEVVRSVIGIPKEDTLFELLGSISSGNIAGAISSLEELTADGLSYKYLVDMAIETLIDTSLCIEIGEGAIANTRSYIECLKKFASQMGSSSECFRFLNSFKDIRIGLTKDSVPEVLIKSEFIKLAVSVNAEQKTAERLLTLEKEVEMLKKGVVVPVSDTSVEDGVSVEPMAAEVFESVVEETKETNEEVPEEVAETVSSETDRALADLASLGFQIEQEDDEVEIPLEEFQRLFEENKTEEGTKEEETEEETEEGEDLDVSFVNLDFDSAFNNPF